MKQLLTITLVLLAVSTKAQTFDALAGLTTKDKGWDSIAQARRDSVCAVRGHVFSEHSIKNSVGMYISLQKVIDTPDSSYIAEFNYKAGVRKYCLRCEREIIQEDTSKLKYIKTVWRRNK